MNPLPIPADGARPHIAVLRFYVEHVDQPGKPGEFEEVHWVEYVKKGSNGATTNEKVRRLKKSNPAIWSVVEPVYKGWVEGQAEPTDGTPLSAWPGVNSAMADRLKMMHLRTVEDIAAMTDADFHHVGMGARVLRDRAQAFIQAKKGEAVVAEVLATARADNERQAAEMADMRETIKAMADQLRELKPGAHRKAQQAAQPQAAD